MSGEVVLQIVVLILGMGICTGAGLLSLIPSLEEPVKFIPIYTLSMSLFLGGLATIFWFQKIESYISDQWLTG